MDSVPEFSVKEDNWSLQITSLIFPRFFIRITSGKKNPKIMVFSDFILEPGDNEKAEKALQIIKNKFYGPAPEMKIVFQNIYPAYVDKIDRMELIRRHDQIVDVVKKYVYGSEIKVANTFLEPDGNKFNTIVMVA